MTETRLSIVYFLQRRLYYQRHLTRERRKKGKGRNICVENVKLEDAKITCKILAEASIDSWRGPDRSPLILGFPIRTPPLCIGRRNYIYEIEAAGCDALAGWKAIQPSRGLGSLHGSLPLISNEGRLEKRARCIHIRRNASPRLIGLSPIDVNGGPMFDALHVELNHAFNLAAGLSVPQRRRGELVSVFTRSEEKLFRSQDEWYDFIKLLSGKFSTYFSRSDYVNAFS